ncbi:hypothetical protein K466DRAFT_607481, partial [Polyporus arcularius HHB13444]
MSQQKSRRTHAKSSKLFSLPQGSNKYALRNGQVVLTARELHYAVPPPPVKAPSDEPPCKRLKAETSTAAQVESEWVDVDGAEPGPSETPLEDDAHAGASTSADGVEVPQPPDASTESKAPPKK